MDINFQNKGDSIPGKINRTSPDPGVKKDGVCKTNGKIRWLECGGQWGRAPGRRGRRRSEGGMAGKFNAGISVWRTMGSYLREFQTDAWHIRCFHLSRFSSSLFARIF